MFLGNQMLRAIQRIERRVQRERMVAVTGKDAVDSDEEKEVQAPDGDDVEGAVQEEDDNNDKDEEGEEDKEETYQSTRGPKDQYDLNDDFIDDSEVLCCTRRVSSNNTYICVFILALASAFSERYLASSLAVALVLRTTCAQFIEAIEMRDDRKLKHQGFFVNSGTVERVGEKVDVVAHYRPRRKRAPTDEGQQSKAKSAAASRPKNQVRQLHMQ